MFTEKEQAYLKGLIISALRIQQEKEFSTLKPVQLCELFTDYLEDYFSHVPLTDFPDND